VFTARPYSVPDILLGTFWISRGWGKKGIGAGISLYGNDVYREESMTASTGFRSSAFGSGVSISVNRVVIEGLGQRSFGSVTFGFTYGEKGGMRVGGVLRDVIRFGSRVREEVRPTVAVSATVSLPSTGALLLAEVRGSSRYPISFSLGIESGLWKTVMLRMGLGKNPSIYSVGLGVSISFFRVDLGIEEHSLLGQTRSVSITITPSLVKQ
jgi:hypothetical protein